MDATSVISPSGGYFENLPVLILGHFAEGILSAAAFYPNLYIRETLGESLELDKENDFTIGIMKLYKTAGRSCGLSARIRELFGKHSQWMEAWLILSYLSFGQYKVKDI